MLLLQKDLELITTGLFFRYVAISEIELCIDYKPKKSLLSTSSISAFILNVFKLEEAKIILQSVQLYGIQGISPLSIAILDAWVPFVKNTQAQQVILNSWTPIRTFIKFGNDLGQIIMLPVHSSQEKAPSTISLVRKGVIHSVNITSQIATTTKNYLKRADVFFSSLSGVTPITNQLTENPKNIGSGFKRGLSGLTYCFEQSTLQIESEANVNIFKAIPLAFVRPILGVTEAVDYTVTGLANTLDQNRWCHREEKYKKK